MNNEKLISIVIPIYNEEDNIRLIYAELLKVLKTIDYRYEMIFVDDGSTDRSMQVLEKLAAENPDVKYLQFSRNFGKEIATSAGLKNARGDAVIMIDADMQHPPQKIVEFIKKWEEGAEVAIGVRNKSKSDRLEKRIGSSLYYKLINSISDTKTVSQATDFRLLDRVVVDEFNKLTERNRLTRALIDWLGFRREYIYFDANSRAKGEAKYDLIKLVRLALSSFVSMSLAPLKVAGYLGLAIILVSAPLGVFIFIEKYILGDPWKFRFSGPAILAVIILFLVGIILACLGIIALYIANIQVEVSNRPMYVLRKDSQNFFGPSENSSINI